MMRKTLWALSMLFVLSGCNDGGEESGYRRDTKVNTTFNIQYSLNYDLPSINYPATYSQQSEMIEGIPEILPIYPFRFVVELWEEIPNTAVTPSDPDDSVDNPDAEEPSDSEDSVDNPDAENPAEPEPGVSYRRYGRYVWTTTNHIPVDGQEDRYVFSETVRLTRSKFKVIIWADYSTRGGGDRYFTTDSPGNRYDANLYGLRDVTAQVADQREYYDGFSSIQDIDLTVFEDEYNPSTTIEASVERALGKYTLIATDFEDYKNSVSEEEYKATKEPLEVRIHYGGDYSEDVALENGFRAFYDGLKQSHNYYMAGSQSQNPVISEDGKEMILTFDYAFADPDGEPLKDVMITVYGPMNTPLRAIKISELPLERNKETFFRGPFLFKEWENGSDENGITIYDDFDEKGNPIEI